MRMGCVESPSERYLVPLIRDVSLIRDAVAHAIFHKYVIASSVPLHRE